VTEQFQMNQQEQKTADDLRRVTLERSLESRAAYETLLGMHTYKRPHGCRTEKRFINRFIFPLGMKVDGFGNYWKQIGESPLMWSCHTDTVHSNKGMLRIGFDKNEIGVAEKDDANCLGADDGAGVWLMQQMILAERPGLYLFHRAEEIGRKGSSHIAKNYAKDLTGIKFAIALDRKGKDSIITHQQSARCCSEAFSKSLAAQLNMGYKSDDTGSYTDTASYVDLIGECTNLSVGYTGAHTRLERLDIDFIFKLRDALMTLDASKLDDIRKPGEKAYKSYVYSGGTNYNYDKDRVLLYKETDGTGREYFYRGGQKYYAVLDPTDADDEWGFNYGGEAGYTPPKHNGTGRSMVLISGTATGKQVGTGATPGADDAAIINHGSVAAASHDDAEERKKLADVLRGKIAGRPGIKLDAPPVVVDDDDEEPMTSDVFKKMVELVRCNPDVVADILEQMGYDYSGLSDEIIEAVGVANIS
jgi:hypothetical protein